jgi:hypothetical protein
MSETVFATGGCQCGTVRYEFLAAPEKSHVCHCRMCQKAVGNIFAALVGVRKNKLRWTGEEPHYFASSNLATRGFCNLCGTPLSFAYNIPEARIYVTIGSLDDPAAVPIERQFGTESRISWVDFCKAVPGETTGSTSGDFLAGMKNNQF